MTPGPTATEAAILRQQAGDLLTRLLVDRDLAEQRLAAAGRRDPLKAVTGVTALEQAIASTRDMIAHMDLLLVELDAGIQGAQRLDDEREHPAAAESLLRSSSAPAPVRARTAGMLFAKRPIAASA